MFVANWSDCGTVNHQEDLCKVGEEGRCRAVKEGRFVLGREEGRVV